MRPASIRTARLDLVLMTPAFLDSLLAGRRGDARRLGGFVFPDDWPDAHDERFLRLRLRQMREQPEAEQWLARAMVLREPERPMIGHIGFHGPPQGGAAEMGYTVFPEHRRQGYAIEAAEGMMDWAQQEHGIHRFIVSVSPGNAPSLAMAARLGFRKTGEHMDPEDGLELVFELLRE